MLLHWAILEPTGSSGLAAIRFTSPVQIKTVRVYPTGAQPFASTDILARTEPYAFSFNLYLNAQPMTTDAKQKHKVTNALVTSQLAYTGDCMEFIVGMDSEYATRLLVIQADGANPFECISIGIYGDVASELSPPPSQYSPHTLASIEHARVNPALDVANAADPTSLSRQLLELIPDAPPLPLVVRLMFCLKASNDDWDHPDFPYLYTDMNTDDENIDLEELYERTSRAVPDDISPEDLSGFAGLFARALHIQQDSKRQYWVSRILLNSASQHPDFAPLLMQHTEPSDIFDKAVTLESDTLWSLADAAANEHIARYLDNHHLLRAIKTRIADKSNEREETQAARKLESRIRGWLALDDALLNSRGDFPEAVSLLADVGKQERSLGIWLESMITRPDIIRKLAENPVLPDPIPPPDLLTKSPTFTSHDEFITFLKAYIGVSCVLAVYAWADSVPNERCRERALAIIRLWQGAEGYQSITNHLMLLRQMTFRLGCMTDTDPPSRSGQTASQILTTLSREPKAFLRPDFRDTLLNLPSTMLHIDHEKRLLLVNMADLAEDDLAAAFNELAQSSLQPISMDRLSTMRVALAMVNEVVSSGDSAEWELISALWKIDAHGVLVHLIEVLLTVGECLKVYFLEAAPPSISQEHVNLAFLAAQETISIINYFLPLHPLPTRPLRAFVAQLADLFVCTDAADLLFSQSSPAFSAAQNARQTCIVAARTLCTDGREIDGTVGTAHVMQALFHTVHTVVGDPIHYLSQIFVLLDYVLPMATDDGMDIDQVRSYWATQVLPSVLSELGFFFRALDIENKIHLINRFVDLDAGMVGIGEYFLLEELRHLEQGLLLLRQGEISHRLLLESDVASSIELLQRLTCSSTPTAKQWTAALSSDPDVSAIFSTCLREFVALRVWSPQFHGLVKHVAAGLQASNPIAHQVSVALLFSAQASNQNPTEWASTLGLVGQIEKTTLKDTLDPAEKRRELTLALVAFVEANPTSPLDYGTAQSILDLVTRLGMDSLIAGACAKWKALADNIINHLPSDLTEVARTYLTVEGNMQTDSPILPWPKLLATEVNIPAADLLTLFDPAASAPATPPLKPIKELTPDVLAMVTTSPSALLRSPESITGLTKTYTSNSFRELRSVPSARQNTSRLPSRHVDDFQVEAVIATATGAPLPFNSSLGPAFNMSL